MRLPVVFTCSKCGERWQGEVEDLGYEHNTYPREDCWKCGSLELETEEAEPPERDPRD